MDKKYIKEISELPPEIRCGSGVLPEIDYTSIPCSGVIPEDEKNKIEIFYKEYNNYNDDKPLLLKKFNLSEFEEFLIVLTISLSILLGIASLVLFIVTKITS